MTPEVMKGMTPDQRAFVEEGKQAFSLKGKTPTERLDELQNILKNGTNINK
jgi:hypothetical protein